MQYTPEQFIKLTELVMDQGGLQLDELCEARYYDLTGPRGKRPGKKLYFPGCGNTTIFSIPYPLEDDRVGTIRLCAVCDDLGVKPRFSACLEA